MTRNEAGWDRVARVAFGALLLSLTIVGPHTPWGLLGLIPLATGAVGFCPIYRACHVGTRRR